MITYSTSKISEDPGQVPQNPKEESKETSFISAKSGNDQDADSQQASVSKDEIGLDKSIVQGKFLKIKNPNLIA